MTSKNIMPETCDNEWFYVYNKDKSISSQIIYKNKYGYILNVSKIYTDSIYFGISIQLVDTKNKLYTMIKCKDRGITEEQADDKDYFLYTWAEELLEQISPKGENNIFNSIATFIEQDYVFDNINNSNVSVNFGYVDNVYRFTNIVVGDIASRGIYSVKDISKKPVKVCIPIGSVPTEEQVINLYKDTKLSLSNVWTYVNTQYSDIKIYRDEPEEII
jgi:hypothetical protein